MNKPASVQPLSAEQVLRFLPDRNDKLAAVLALSSLNDNHQCSGPWYERARTLEGWETFCAQLEALASGQHKTYDTATHRAVPIEPTQEMMDAGAMSVDNGKTLWDLNAATVYRAMLQAADTKGE